MREPIPALDPAATVLDRASRARALAGIAEGELDLLVVGGGVTGAGIALDAASRGLRVGVVEARDWASGTSAASSKLVHGGLRYLYRLDVKLVAEALRERGLLLDVTAPHLVKAQPFLWPLLQPWVERPYTAAGIGVYDALAQFGGGGRNAVPNQQHLGRRQALAAMPSLRDDALIGAVRFYDARVDDARLVLALVRTAQGHGAMPVSRARVESFVRDGERVAGAVIVDALTGERHEVRAKHVIGAVGVWTEELQRLATDSPKLRVLASKGVHLVVPRDRIAGHDGVFVRTEKSVLFIIPWRDHWLIGTTDTPYEGDLAHPVADDDDVDYLLERANAVLREPLGRGDVIATYAGLRPLLRPVADGAASTKVSREHTVAEVVPGLSAIAGGKLTTYRVMAEDAVDFAIERAGLVGRASVTARLPLVGAAGYRGWQGAVDAVGSATGLGADRVQRLLDRYGDELPRLIELVSADRSLAEPLAGAPEHLRAEVAYAVTHEGALDLGDVLRRRLRVSIEQPAGGAGALDEAAAIAGPLLGWDAAETEAAKARFLAGD
ncbi:MAG: glycerol-3-phosphate dehydrogenase/oxidase [Microbacteriaceae bacterium]|nr:glycerol-3-phosphate dehydrogenase/oxidase [Microbacteriaceae bacterium]